MVNQLLDIIWKCCDTYNLIPYKLCYGDEILYISSSIYTTYMLPVLESYNDHKGVLVIYVNIMKFQTFIVIMTNYVVRKVF